MELIFGEKGVELQHPEGNWQLKKGVGFSPVEMTAASVAACGMYVFEDILKNSKVDFRFDKVETNYERSETKPAKPISKVMIDFYLEVPQEQQERVLRISKMINKHCPVMQTLDPEVVIEEQVHFV